MADDILDASENEQILAQVLGELDVAPEPGTARVGNIEHRGNDEAPAPIIQTKLSSAGYVYIYDTKTGDRSLTNRNMLPVQLKKSRADGSKVFTTIDPNLKIKRNQIKCRLHVDDEERRTWDEMGFAVCRKSNLVSQFHLNRHMQRTHKDEWEAIQTMQYEREREEDQEFKRTLMAQAARSGWSLPSMEMPKRRTKNPNRVAAGKRTAQKLMAEAV